MKTLTHRAKWVASAGAFFALVACGVAQTNWDAFNDFYFNPASVSNTGGSWTGNTVPNPAWQYGGGNVNGIGAPPQIGSYLADGSLFYTTTAGGVDPGVGQYIGYGSGHFLAYYTDNQGWGEQVGIYNYGVSTNFPGYGQINTNRLWLQCANLEGGTSESGLTAAEGIAAVVQWTAPISGAFQFSGSFLPASQDDLTLPNAPFVDVAVTSLAQGVNYVDVAETNLSWGDSAFVFPTFSHIMNKGESVQFQVGDYYQAGTPVGLQADVVEIPTPPVLQTATLSSQSKYQVTVSYSVAVDPISSLDPTNYALNNGYKVLAAKLDGPTTVILTVVPGITNKSILTINGVKSAFGLDPIAANSSATITPPQTSWDAFNDFYFYPTSVTNTSGGSNTWTGNISVNPAWEYAAVNLNLQGGEPSVVGGYYGIGPTVYPLAKGQEIPSPGYFADTGAGTYLAYYSSSYGWGDQEGIYNYGAPNFPGAGSTNNTRLWLQAGNIDGTGQFAPTAVEGIGAAVVWTAPLPGVYQFTGSFLPASSQSQTNANGPTVDVAVCSTALGVQTTNMPRTVLTWGSGPTAIPTFSLQMNGGDNVEFQVGDNYQAGSPVGLQVDVTSVPQAPALRWALATAANGTQVTVDFSEPLDPVSTANTSNYSIPGESVVGASLSLTNTSQAILTISPGIAVNSLTKVTVNGVKSDSGLLPVAANSTTPIIYQTSWDAFNDFFFDPAAVVNTGGSWSGNTNFNPTWVYAADNVNGVGAPAFIGTFGDGNYNDIRLYSASSGTASYTAEGPGDYFAYYTDSYGWGTQVGIYNYGWASTVPGYGVANTNRLWLQGSDLGQPGHAAEGIAGALLWVAPYNGTFTFSGSFLPASSGTAAGNGPTVDVAIADIVNGVEGTILPRTILTWGSPATNYPPFTLTLQEGDRIEWQAGGNYYAGTPVGVQADVKLVTPSNVSLGITVSGGNAVLSWPTSATGFTLQSSSTLPGSWSNVGTSVVVNGSENTVTVPLNRPGAQFFRLTQ